jgi:RNase H-like domain found in reverse transcriptase/Reverse transcriptase (RNA-dependent DNA polymerase)
MKHAYHLIRIAIRDEWKTAFHTCYGSFEWLVMPFRLTNAPGGFQRFLNGILSDLLDVYVIIYLDDILVFSGNKADHFRHVSEVLKRLRKHGLYANGKKCDFYSEPINYLGYMIGPNGLQIDPAKVKVIQDWPEPWKVKDVRSFLGFANFYRQYIHNYSDIVVLLTCLTWKNIPWNFDESCKLAFLILKLAFISTPILTHYKPGCLLVIETDASDYALAAFFSQVESKREIHPVTYVSRTFSDTELNYDMHDKELMAIYEAFKAWRHYLKDTKVLIDVVTDHKNLEYFCTTRILSRRQARWSTFLSGFNMVIRFHPWESISMDFIEQLPDSEGFTAILVVVDRFTKQALFILTHDTITSAQLALSMSSPNIEFCLI